MRFRLLLFLMLPMIAACSHAYHPLKDGAGFTDVPIGPDKFQITFVGDTNMAPAEAHRLALLRAAELAVLRDVPYFRVDEAHVYVMYGSRYWSGSDTRYVNAYRDRRGRTYYEVHHNYTPGYSELFSVPEAGLQVTLTREVAAPSIPAAYLVRQAEAEKIKLSPGVAERAALLPRDSGPVMLPAAPTPATRPAM